MKRNQLIVLWVGIAVFILMGLFPLKEGYSTGGGRSRFPREWHEPYYGFFISGSIKWDALIIQWAIVVVTTGGLIYTLGIEPQLPRRIWKWLAANETNISKQNTGTLDQQKNRAVETGDRNHSR